MIDCKISIKIKKNVKNRSLSHDTEHNIDLIQTKRMYVEIEAN